MSCAPLVVFEICIALLVLIVLLVVKGRLCSSLTGFTCCLPCPQADWLYPDNFRTITTSASWINVVGTICSVFLLASFAFLPVEKTHRHYLSVCLAVAIVIMQVSLESCEIHAYLLTT